MKIAKQFMIIGFMMITIHEAKAEIGYAIKAETGYYMFQHNTIRVEPGSHWRGYNNKGYGYDFNVINSIVINPHVHSGIGIGYLNLGGANGFSLFTDIDYLPLKRKLSPLISVKIGYSHIWNQYENGTGTGLMECALGLHYGKPKGLQIFLKSGWSVTQQSWFFPVKMGIRF
jgi:hypothetical protein